MAKDGTIRVEFHGSSVLMNERSWRATDVQQALNQIFGIKPGEYIAAITASEYGLKAEIGHR